MQHVSPSDLQASFIEETGTFTGVKEQLSFFGGVTTLAIGMLGTGIVAFPYAFAFSGYIGGPLALGVFCVLAQMSYTALIRCTAVLRVTSYVELVGALPGVWKLYTNVALCFSLVMSVAAYVIITAHIIQSVVVGSSNPPPMWFSNTILFAVIVALAFPLCLTSSLHGLQAATSFCTAALFAIVGLIVWKSMDVMAFSPPQFAEAPRAVTCVKSGVLALPMFGCAMYGHTNVAQVYAELRPDLKPRAWLVSLASVAGAAVIYIAVGLSGYAAFGSGADADVVAQLAATSGEGGVVGVLHCLLASLMVLKTPLVVFPVRSILLHAVAPGSKLPELPLRHNVLLTAAVLGWVYGIAIAIPNLGTLLQVLGAVCIVPLYTIVPARVAWSVDEPRPTVQCIVLFVGGAVISAASIAAIVFPSSFVA